MRGVVEGKVVVGWAGGSKAVGQVREGRRRLQVEQVVVVRGVVEGEVVIGWGEGARP